MNTAACDRKWWKGQGKDQLQSPVVGVPGSGEAMAPLSRGEGSLVCAEPAPPTAKRLTFPGTSAARSVGWQHGGAPEGPLQVIMLLRQLLQGLLQPDTLVSFILEGLLPFFTVGLG